MSKEPTNVIQKHFEYFSKRLTADFQRSRETHQDSSVKGTSNELIVEKFIQEHYPANFVATNVEIIDADGKSCDEIDVCVCNRDQPFAKSPGQLLLVEGVDFVIQVKAILTSDEIVRIKKNATRLKSLVRSTHPWDIVHGNVEHVDYFFSRIPYFVFAFTSKLSLETARLRFQEEFAEIPSELQPDAIFILNRGIIMNVRDGKGSPWNLVVSDALVDTYGWVAAETGEHVLFEMMRYIHHVVPTFYRAFRPICHYFPDKAPFNSYFLDDATKPRSSN